MASSSGGDNNSGSDTSSTAPASFWSGALDFFGNFFNNLLGLFVPPASFWADFKTNLENKFTFLAGFNNALEIIQNTEGQPFIHEFSFLGYDWKIDLTFYEPYRLSVRALSSALFIALAGLKCFKMISSVFRVQFANDNNDD